MNDNDFDPDDYVDEFCKRSKCHECNGIDENGEPNGYGCIPLDAYIQSKYEDYLERNKVFKRNYSGRVYEN